MIKYKKIFLSLPAIVVVVGLWSFIGVADDPIATIAARLDEWLNNHPQEKLYLQSDKPYYSVGDTIWFKAYDVVARKHQLSAMSGVLNVELIDELDSVKQSIKLPIQSGVSWGDLPLPDSLEAGSYRIRAFTNWMRNAGEEYFFDKTISIINAITNNVFTKTSYTYSSQNNQQKIGAAVIYTDLDGKPYASKPVNYEIKAGSKTVSKGKGVTDDKGMLNISFVRSSGNTLKADRIFTTIKADDKTTVTKSISIKAFSDKVDVQFFPEGGNIVAGNPAKIAFKAVAQDGLGTPIKGSVTDEHDNEVAIFSSSHLGMGVFSFTPESGKAYKTKLTYADGSENTMELPKVTEQGYSLIVSNAGPSHFSVRILPGPAETAAAATTGTLSLVAQSNGVIYYAGKSEPGKPVLVHIAKNKFPSGIVQFTLFSLAGEPLNERLVFVQNADQLNLDISSKPVYAPREKVKIELNAKDMNNKPVIGSFSVAVTDETKVPVDEASESTILSNLLLTSDIKGYVEKPNYYFTNVNEQTQADLDVLMLTQGYRRFEWKQLLNRSIPADSYKAEKSLSIAGHIKTMGGKPLPNGGVKLLSNKGGFFFRDTVADNSGAFLFDGLTFTNSTKFLIQARSKDDRKNVQIDLDDKVPQRVGPNKNAPDMPVNMSDDLSLFLQNSKTWFDDRVKYGLVKRPVLLKEVVITEKRNKVTHSDNLNGPGNADDVITADKLGNCGNFLSNCLEGRIAGVIFRRNIPYNTRTDAAMAIVLDGNFIDNDLFNDIDPNTVENVEVLLSTFRTTIYGSRGANGILLVTTKRGKSNNGYERYAPGVITYTPRGYYRVREFYSPQYAAKTNSQLPDLRSTVYWKPNIVTGKDGKASFNYFNADTKGSYRVVIEGIDAEGNLGRQVYRYKVE